MMASTNEDAPIRHFSLAQRTTSWISQHVFGQLVYTCRHGLLKGLRRRGGLGWLPAFLSSSVENDELRFWRSLNLTGRVVYDVGSYHGLLALYFAKAAKTVVCFEPNEANLRRLRDNIALNGMKNVVVRPVGVGSTPSTAVMVYSPLMSGAGTIEAATSAERAMSEHLVRQPIEIATLDAELEAGLPAPGFVKIDIEGAELDALRGATRMLATARPDLFLEMHGNSMREKREKVQAVVKFLLAADYAIRHIETGEQITADNATVALEGHLFAVHASNAGNSASASA